MENLQLPVFQTHAVFVADVKAAVRKVYGIAPDPATVLPTIVGAKSLDFTMPPMMEETFGYGGKLRFLEFSFSPKTRRFGYSDGGDHIPSNEELWLKFVNHPLIAVQLMDHDCPTLYGQFARVEAHPACPNLYWMTQDRVETWHCLLFDRQQRRPYLCTRRQMIFFLPLTEPEGMDEHTLFVGGRLLSPGSENFKTLPSAETEKGLVAWLDNEASELEKWLHEEE